MGVKIHTVFVTYNRLELTKIAISSYLETVTLPYSLCVVDNASTDGTRNWLLDLLSEKRDEKLTVVLFDRNYYPGRACNIGWQTAPGDTTLLQRADNDFAFLPGWCDLVVEAFLRNERLGQLGLRTDEEECFVKMNVGGNCVIRRELWENGLRYDETPWTDYPPGYSEDSYFSPAVQAMGWEWDRVDVSCLRSLASGDLSDPYYRESYGARRIVS
ncbi:MAG: hypothetical protein KatS3mg015_2540 [Fimbriimonadales bacterium]|nr:MAG: hypothetical protein KatS3mg015_2540 [Fimbriimonadales bacterium]